MTSHGHIMSLLSYDKVKIEQRKQLDNAIWLNIKDENSMSCKV